MLRRIAEGACAAMFACVFVIFVTKIIMRYAAHSALAWADEVSVVLFIWIVFAANAVLVEDRRQISFDLLYRHIPARAQRVMGVFRAVLITAIFAASLPGAADYTAFLWRERTPVLLWRLDVVYACFALFMLCVIVRRLVEIRRLLGRSWREAL
jgi:TRAP-type C4-dicarboxylate transport system permease small subunit